MVEYFFGLKVAYSSCSSSLLVPALRCIMQTWLIFTQLVLSALGSERFLSSTASTASDISASCRSTGWADQGQVADLLKYAQDGVTLSLCLTTRSDHSFAALCFYFLLYFVSHWPGLLRLEPCDKACRHERRHRVRAVQFEPTLGLEANTSGLDALFCSKNREELPLCA